MLEREKKRNVHFGNPEFPYLREVMGVLMKFRVVQLQWWGVIKTEQNRDYQQQSDRGQERH